MKSYGKFQAVRELYQTPLGAIWAARSTGDEGPPLACLKLIQPESAVFEGGGAAAASVLGTFDAIGTSASTLVSTLLTAGVLLHEGLDGLSHLAIVLQILPEGNLATVDDHLVIRLV